MLEKELVIIGAGPAGLAAAIAAHEQGIRDILVLEREDNAGGILNQCIHDGFGLNNFKESLTGPEYAARYIVKAAELNIEILPGSMAVGLNRDKIVTVMNRKQGRFMIKARAVVLATGSRERTAGAIRLPGERPAGIYTAGLVQNLINLNNIMVGKKVVILGSGDIGLIMARRLTLEGAEVKAVLEIMPYSNGLQRNINQCLYDYGIPLELSHTVTGLEGNGRLKAVIVSKVDDNLNPVPGTEKKITCDTLVLSVGLIPENELAREASVQLDDLTGGPLIRDNYETNISGIFSCGNALHINDLVDYVSEEGAGAGNAAAKYLKHSPHNNNDYIYVYPGQGVSYVIPQVIKRVGQEFSLRIKKPVSNQKLIFSSGGKVIFSKNLRKGTPAEMIKIRVKQEFMEMIESSCIEVELS